MALPAPVQVARSPSWRPQTSTSTPAHACNILSTALATHRSSQERNPALQWNDNIVRLRVCCFQNRKSTTPKKGWKQEAAVLLPRLKKATSQGPSQPTPIRTYRGKPKQAYEKISPPQVILTCSHGRRWRLRGNAQGMDQNVVHHSNPGEKPILLQSLYPWLSLKSELLGVTVSGLAGPVSRYRRAS